MILSLLADMIRPPITVKTTGEQQQMECEDFLAPQQDPIEYDDDQ
jgi:hypothetical protein